MKILYSNECFILILLFKNTFFIPEYLYKKIIKMSNINLRKNIINGIFSKYLIEYIEHDINKDEFIEMFNKGKLIIDNIKLKNGKNFIIDSKFK